MNVRIKQLAKQSGLWFVTQREDLIRDFAELIVQECADTVLGFHNQFGDSAHREIREHFGVES